MFWLKRVETIEAWQALEPKDLSSQKTVLFKQYTDMTFEEKYKTDKKDG